MQQGGLFVSPQKLNSAAFEETLRAAELLLATHDLKGCSKKVFEGQERLGFASAILLFSFIEAFGHLTANRSNCEKSFLVLKEKAYGIENLEDDACIDLYRIYRNKLIHNMMLPKNVFLDCSIESKDILTTSENRKHILKVNLYALLQASKKAWGNYKENHTVLFLASQRLCDVLKITRELNSEICVTTPSGITSVPPLKAAKLTLE